MSLASSAHRPSSFSIVSDGSISMTSRLETPGEVGSFVKSHRKASEREWAGSVLTRRTRLLQC